MSGSHNQRNHFARGTFRHSRGSSRAFRDVDGIPPSILLGKNGGKPAEKGNLVDWRWCLIPIEIKTDRSRHEDKDQAVFQLATYVCEVFAAQPHRRFVPSQMFTESTAEFFLWDRAGFICSKAFDYHAEAARFCRIIATILSWNDEALGFDTSLQFAKNGLHISTGSDEYVVDAFLPVIQPYNIRSDGATCWIARRRDDNNIYLVQDTWSENWMTLESIRLKRNTLSSLVPDWISFEVVHIPALGDTVRWDVDSVSSNRRLVGVKANLDHCRSVWRCSADECVPLERFTTPLELVCVLRDVVQVPWNIFILRKTKPEPESERITRGFLVNFSHGAFMDERAISPRSDLTPSSKIFMPRNALRKYPTTHCDDLESLYYLFCFIITAHTGPSLGKSRLPHDDLPDDLQLWFQERPGSLATAKKGHLAGQEFMIPVQNAFKPLEPLAIKLHSFLHSRTGYSKDDAREPPPYPFTPEHDFSEFLGYFEETIKEMEFISKQGTGDNSDNNVEDNLGSISERTSGHPRKRAAEEDLHLERDTKRAKRAKCDEGDNRTLWDVQTSLHQITGRVLFPSASFP
ncbi:hypothetical protein JB92DRAFT_2837657 [Gautieria morchelliformis]|nr:hypothetical protein JB92DRAFT_2837657 [Gautieria morchelliformis]